MGVPVTISVQRGSTEMKTITNIAAALFTTASVAAAAPVDRCARIAPFWKTLIGSCHDAQRLEPDRSTERASQPTRPDKPNQPNKPERPSKPDKPERPTKRDHKNASENNGKGGNYDRTGHSDNGKGKGRERK